MAEIYPVVHVNRPGVAIEMANLALNYGADGVFLINHNAGREAQLIEAYNEVTTQNPNSFVGLNFLERQNSFFAFLYLQDALQSGEITRLPDGLWVDDADPMKDMTQELREDDPDLKAVRYFGGIAFKYTRLYTPEAKPAAWQARRLAYYVDDITTSGEGTGRPPSIEKIALMKAAARFYDKPLAVASGISAENLRDYNGDIDKVLVSTSIEVEPYSGIFVPTKLKEIIEAGKS